MEPEGTYYRYIDQTGTPAVVDSIQKIPAKYRKKKAYKVLTPSSLPKLGRSLKSQEAPPANSGQVMPAAEAKAVPRATSPKAAMQTLPEKSNNPFQGLHLPSLGLGFGLGLCCFFIVKAFSRSNRLVVRLLLILLPMALITILYLGWISQQSGLSTGTGLANPVSQAQQAVSQMEERLRQQEALINQLLDEKGEKRR